MSIFEGAGPEFPAPRDRKGATIMTTATTRTMSRSGPESAGNLTPAELHACGVDIVRQWMEQDGFRILGVCRLHRYNPQIIAELEGRLCHVIVRTGVHPCPGFLGNEEGLACVEHAAECSALCYFANITLVPAAAADGGDEGAMRQPLRAAGFYVSCDGLKIMTTPERIGSGS
jgi:hypothetical protein